MNKCIILYKSCIPVRGSRRSIIIDTQRYKVYYIPNDLYDILSEHQGKTLEQIQSLVAPESKHTLNDYFNFLTKNNMIFYCDENEIEFFPEMSTEWDYPSKITNAVIEYDGSCDLNYTLNQLDKLGCYNIQFIFKTPINSIDTIDNLLLPTIDSVFRYFEVIIEDNKFSTDSLNSFLINHKRVRRLVIHSSDKEDLISNNDLPVGIIVFTKQNYSANKEYILPDTNFILNLPFVSESKTYNTYFNRKMAISKEGYIKNSINHPDNYGIISNVNLFEIVNSKEYQKLWTVNKDKIQICKDCEHRYICFDGRIPVYKNESWEYTSECNYNPIQAKWKNVE